MIFDSLILLLDDAYYIYIHILEDMGISFSQEKRGQNRVDTVVRPAKGTCFGIPNAATFNLYIV